MDLIGSKKRSSELLRFKKKWALVGCSIQSERGIVHYDEAQLGSGRALEEAIEVMGKREKMDLSQTKLLFFGHSAGGQFGFHFACWKPERVIAFVASKGGCYNESLITKNVKKVPGLWIIGEQDEKWRNESIKKISQKNKSYGVWKTKIDSKTGHELGTSENIAREEIEKNNFK